MTIEKIAERVNRPVNDEVEDDDTADVSAGRGGALDPPPPEAIPSEDPIEAEIDRDIDGTFPASDPPGWSLGAEAESAYERLQRKEAAASSARG